MRRWISQEQRLWGQTLALASSSSPGCTVGKMIVRKPRSPLDMSAKQYCSRPLRMCKPKLYHHGCPPHSHFPEKAGGASRSCPRWARPQPSATIDSYLNPTHLDFMRIIPENPHVQKTTPGNHGAGSSFE